MKTLLFIAPLVLVSSISMAASMQDNINNSLAHAEYGSPTFSELRSIGQNGSLTADENAKVPQIVMSLDSAGPGVLRADLQEPLMVKGLSLILAQAIRQRVQTDKTPAVDVGELLGWLSNDGESLSSTIVPLLSADDRAEAYRLLFNGGHCDIAKLTQYSDEIIALKDTEGLQKFVELQTASQRQDPLTVSPCVSDQAYALHQEMWKAGLDKVRPELPRVDVVN